MVTTIYTRARALAFALAILLLASAASATTGAVYESDPWITGKVKMELMLSSKIDASDLHVDTVDRVVTLQGTVPTREQRQLLEKLAAGVTGVQGVRDLVRVVPADQLAAVEIGDAALKRRINWALNSDPWLADSSLRAESVTEGMVVIGGHAASMSDHLRALTLVRGMEGVKGVASVVDSPSVLSDEEILRSDLPRAGWDSDAQVTARVKLALAAAEDVTAPSVNVDTRDGVVTLFGTVTGAGMEKRVLQTALSVEGVRRVTDDLEIVPGKPPKQPVVSDADLSSRVSQFLDAAGDAFAGIRATVHDGTVQLAGRVPHQSTRLAAVVRVRAVPGVRSVSENLQVVGNKATGQDAQGG